VLSLLQADSNVATVSPQDWSLTQGHYTVWSFFGGGLEDSLQSGLPQRVQTYRGLDASADAVMASAWDAVFIFKQGLETLGNVPWNNNMLRQALQNASSV